MSACEAGDAAGVTREHFREARMDDGTTSTTIRFGFLPFGYRVEFSLEREIKSDQLRSLYIDLVSNVLPERVRTDEALLDLKGADRGEDPATGTPREELLSVSGEISPPAAQESDAEAAPSPSPFEFLITSRFKEFEGNHHIRHAVLRTAKGITLSPPNPILLAVEEGVTITRFSIGLEYFESRFASVFGYSPVVTHTLRVDCSPQKLAVTILSEGLSKKTDPLLPRDEIFSKLRAAIVRNLQLDIQAHLRR